MDDRVLSTWWFLLVLAAFGGVGYLTGGKLSAVEGLLVALILAHGALLEVLRSKLTEIDRLRAKLSAGGIDD